MMGEEQSPQGVLPREIRGGAIHTTVGSFAITRVD